ncbi:MarR family transcriptional regulator [Clostridium sp. CX1]|uniref:MarR family winged helix-turn-helix transcriptional regulator n=1 Tax=Clostridium sp. CX1 TaxID=2978346 RepID=UPI0021BE7AFB|nr:MarR family transcriptional regulator [Clostridium sp. CX1]MCT8978452.1 MarR family transcriptional regulator [Clostridium sp. CX1]
MDNKDKIIGLIDNYYDAWFEINNIYHDWAKRHGMQDTTLFVLYVIKNTVPYCTQSEICNKLYLPKQTVSQILSGLEKERYITREPNTKDRRNKVIRLTEEGTSFATSILEELKSAEIEAFNQMSEKQRSTVVEGFKLLCDSLNKSLSK